MTEANERTALGRNIILVGSLAAILFAGGTFALMHHHGIDIKSSPPGNHAHVLNASRHDARAQA